MLILDVIVVLLVLIPFYWLWNFIFMTVREILYLIGINTFTREELKNIYKIEINHPHKVEVLPPEATREFDYIDIEILHRKKRRRR